MDIRKEVFTRGKTEVHFRECQASGNLIFIIIRKISMEIYNFVAEKKNIG